MESHTLEILQQGVWASLTGGWFYDLRQNVFCNTFHLYLWLFLLCFPFILHLYFQPSIVIYSLYCGTVSVLFTTLKLLNHRLHKMYDTSECIEEIIPEEDLPESQKKKSQQNLNATTILEEEGIELQVLRGHKATDIVFNCSFNEPTDDDSIISLEVGAKAISSTIDLKVDVHRKNSSESSEELSVNAIGENSATVSNKTETVNLLKESNPKTPDVNYNSACKHNQLNNVNLILKTEEGMSSVEEFALSQSDCHIAKIRKESMEELSEEYKISKSDCHISNLRQSTSDKNDVKNSSDFSPNIPCYFNTKDAVKRKRRKAFYRHFHSTSQNGPNLSAIEKNKSFDMGTLASNGSCGILPLNRAVNKELFKNTGSLELPLKDNENALSSEKGLLYWKQQNLDQTKVDKIKNSQKLQSCATSETSLHSSNQIFNENSRFFKGLDSNGEDEILEDSICCNKENLSQSDQKEKTFLKILEENFDWYSSEYQNEKPEKLKKMKVKLKDIAKYKSDEDIKSVKMEKKSKSGLKFQIDSDEDSSDNCGSRSPLLCRHESLEREKHISADILYGEKSEKDITRTFSNAGKLPQTFSKINRTLSVDENVVLSNKLKNKTLENSEKNSFSSFLLTVYDDSAAGMQKDGSNCESAERNLPSADSFGRFGKFFPRQESFLHRNKKLTLPVNVNIDCENMEGNSENLKEEQEKKESVAPVTNDKGSLDWLFEHTDSETENTKVQCECSCEKKVPKVEISHSYTPANRSIQNQGAIPKTRKKPVEGTHSKKPSQLKNSTRKIELRHNIYPNAHNFLRADSNNDIQVTDKKKLTAERENEIIDEEDTKIFQENIDASSKSEGTQRLNAQGSSWKKTPDSGSSATELSSLLPLSSLLSSLHPPTSPLLAAFLATRKEICSGGMVPNIGFDVSIDKNIEIQNEDIIRKAPFSRNKNKRSKRPSRGERSSRSTKISSLPLDALASVVSTNAGTHIAISHDDTSQGAVHCFQDEKGNWLSYTFDSQSTKVTHFPVPLPKQSCSIINHNNESFEVEASDMSNTNKNSKPISYPGNGNNSCENNESIGTSKILQPILRSTCVQTPNVRERDINFSNVKDSRTSEDSISRHPHFSENKKSNQCRRKNVQNDKVQDKPQKLKETSDSNINLVSNSNSENESSLSLNSATISPIVDLGLTRPTFASFVRERFMANQRSLIPTTNSNLNTTNPSLNSGSLLVGVSEFRQNDSNNNNNSNNDNNNNVSNNNNNNIINNSNSNNNNNSTSINNSSLGSNFFSERISANPIPVRSPFGLITEGFLERNRQRAATFHSPTIIQDPHLAQHGNEQGTDRNPFRLFDCDEVEPNLEVKNHPRHYYKLYYTPWNFVKIRFDRLELMALLDRNLTVFEILLSIFLLIADSICGVILLNYGFYRDLFAFLFCFALAGCQYSLLKSVQPDATSPTHGYNRVVLYSRSIYFCITSALILFLTTYLENKPSYSFHFYNIQVTNDCLIRTIRDGLVDLLLFFPVLFTLGLFPQINTFCLYLLEQVDMHIFGGNAMSTLIGAAYCVLRSIGTIIFIYGFAYGALSEAKTSQHILFSIFSALLISLSYHFSRLSSNPSIFWDILKTQLFQDELQEQNYSKQNESKEMKKTDMDKSMEESLKSEIFNKTEGDEKSEDRNSQNNLLLNSNPSSNEMLKTVDGLLKSNLSEIFENSASASDVTSSRKEKEPEDFVDPLPGKLRQTVNARLKNDAIVCSFISLLVFGIHSSTVFTALQPDLNPILWGIAGCSGIILHYIVPELRKHLPWLCLANPVLKCHEHSQYEVRNAARVMWFEETYVILCFLERNLLYPVLVLATITYDGPKICNRLGVPLGALVTCICGLKVMRSAFSNTSQQYLIVIFSALLFEFDFNSYSETFLVDYYFMGIIFSKTYEFLLKVQFVVIYIAPWQITWGSAFHAFAQPFSVPHSAMLFIQAALSAILSAPLNPFLGSAIFLASYVRPIKFWERDYNTKRVDHSNTRLSSHLERNLGSDDNNLNSIFYEHLTRSLQHSLCGDLELGRWGPVYQGDCFVLASDYLNCLVHIIEMGNGLVTFQVRGLEFRGTYCQQREVEAISERAEDDDGCCCCEPCHIPHILSVNAAFSKRWLAWEVIATKYVLEGYSISDNSAASTLQVFDFRKVLVTYYVKSIIFYCIRSPKLQSWLTNPTILTALEPLADRSFVDLDPVFNINIDQDFDTRAEGITRNSFCNAYIDWIQYCCSKREKAIDRSLDSPLISLCLALSLMGRRTLGTASHNTVSSVEFFLYGLHALFKGDFRITSMRDDWIFADMEFLMKVVAPGVRMSLKLHQDHFMSPEEYEDPSALFDAISNHEENLVISHEGDPAWRSAVLSGTPSLLALRHVLDDGTDEYKIIMLNKRYLSFRVIKLNRECVRGLWAGQQQELVFLRNRNPERGSIQNAKQVLRNMINSSCDQPIGYPIYVSPLTTSYSDTNKHLTGIIGGPLSLQGLKNSALKICRRIRQRCREGCSSGIAGNLDDGGYSFGHEGIYAMTNVNVHSGYGHNTSGSQSMDSSQMQLGSSVRGGSLGRSSLGGRGSLPSVGKPSSTTLASLAGFLSSAELPKGECFLRERETSFTFIKEKQNRDEKDNGKKIEEKKEERDRRREEREGRKEKSHGFPSVVDHGDDSKDKEIIYQRVRIVDPNLVFDAINLGRRIDVLWPDEGMRLKGGRSYWKDWLPDTGMEGQVVHRWVPNHRDPSKRSHVDKIIVLIKVDDKYVPIAEAGVQDLGVEV